MRRKLQIMQKEAVEMLANYNILSGDENGCFRPEDNATRQGSGETDLQSACFVCGEAIMV